MSKSGHNPHFKSSYITLDSILQGPVKIFQENNVLILQKPTVGEGFVSIETVLCHAPSGQHISIDTRLPCDTSNAQKSGSGITYARRYALTSILGISSGEDDDANSVTPQHRPMVAAKQRGSNRLTQQPKAVDDFL